MTMTTEEITGAGRDVLVDQIHRLQAERTALASKLAATERENKALTDNVSALQKASTHALTCVRLERRLIEEPRLVAALLDLVWGIDIARGKHPEGSDLTSLVSEVGEVATAMYLETPDRVRSELVDVAVVAVRLMLGEVKEKQVGFAQPARAQ